jgi:hypothetical protein
MLSAYFDDSGSDDGSRTAVVGGYVGTAFQWKRFVARWSAALKAEHVEIMHRADLENFKGEFTEERGWNPDRRMAFVKRLHPIIKQSTYIAVSASVIRKEF